MAVQSFFLLVIFLSKCLGHTEFIYTTKNEVKLFCDTSKWQISTESDNRIDVNCTVKCVPGEQLKLNNIQKFCTNEDLDKVEEKCPLIATGGYFRCVTALDSGFLYPFAPSPNTVTSYIVATANELITNKAVERSSVVLTEGEDVHLNCSFNRTEGYDNTDFSVYWIKTIEKKKTITLCTTIPILLALAIAIVVFIWKRSKPPPGSQAIELQRDQQGGDMEETADVECSPYAVGRGEEVIKFKCKQDALKQKDLEVSTVYSVVKQNDLYEPGLV
ncbi:uncharacterized protein LOC113636770 isoform X3 [Tachysurus fulvidraco]|uniref:uncharacterized protein LOC113636770 isoform X3 n=1 Tax=Tachysurus fulvidraco TaxID=1234273 RepID=UPI001FEE09E2|nr:uncharacterized protein LOC113636770 isoform X3 [Tachysurus fulvidraco]